MAGGEVTRIAFVSPGSNMFGAERSLLETFSRIDRFRFEPHLITLEPGELEVAALMGGTMVHRLPWLRCTRQTWNLWWWISSIRLATWLRRHRVAVLQLNLYLLSANVHLGALVRRAWTWDAAVDRFERHLHETAERQ